MVCERLHRQVVGMTVHPAPGPADPTADPSADPIDACPCPHCGGSGLLRLDSQRFRTCLPCLGQGRIVPLAEAITTAELGRLRAAAGLSAAASVAAA
jgi:hypothetical protein